MKMVRMKCVVSFGLSCVSSVCYQCVWRDRCNGNIPVLYMYVIRAYTNPSHIITSLTISSSGDQSHLFEARAAIRRLLVCVKYI